MAKRYKVSDVLAALDNSRSDSESDKETVNSDDEISMPSSNSDDESGHSSDEEDDDISVDWQKMNNPINNFSRLPFTVINAGIQLIGANIPLEELSFLQLFLTGQLLTEIVVQLTRTLLESWRFDHFNSFRSGQSGTM
jgi:hypothetical protein